MKRFIILMIVVILSISITACNSNKNNNSNTATVEQYKNVAQAYIDKGDIETAKKALEEGISLTQDESLKSMLKEINVSNEEKENNDSKKNEQDVEGDSTKSNTNILSELSQEERKNLNIFLSNFSEAYFDDYSETKNNNAQLIEYSFTHNNINNPDKIIWSGSYMGISANDVERDAQRFFGKTVAYQSVGEWEYRDGIFYTPAAMGESYALFTIATDLRNNNDGTFDVKFSIFYDEDNSFETALPEWYSYTIEQAQNLCVLEGTGTAKIRAKTHSGMKTYELVEYNS